MGNDKLYRAIVGYGFALTTSVGAGASCSSPPPRAVREGVTPHPCERGPCSIEGKVLDVDGSPVSGATVEFDGKKATTAADGSFMLDITGYGGGESRVTATTPDGRETHDSAHPSFAGSTQVELRFDRPAGGSNAIGQ